MVEQEIKKKNEIGYIKCPTCKKYFNASKDTKDLINRLGKESVKFFCSRECFLYYMKKLVDDTSEELNLRNSKQ